MSKTGKFNFGYVAGVIAFAMSAFGPTFASAQDDQGFDLGKYRIDIAGKQRMLTQRIAKTICFIELGYHVEEHHDMLDADFHLFDDTLHLLREGGGEHNLAPETDRRTLQELEIVFGHWEPFKEEIETILATDHVSAEAEEHILEENLIMLKDMNDLVAMIEQEYANPHTLDMSAAVTTNIFARQRMLSQMAAKDFCYVATEHHVEEERANLAKTQALFTASLGALQNGYEALGIPAPPTEEIAAQLEVVAQIWAPMDEIFIRIAEGESPTDEDVAFIAKENLHLQNEMNVAVQMYVAH